MSVIKKPIRDGWCYGVFVLILVITGSPVAVGATPDFVYTRCFETAGSYTPQSLFQSNLNSLLSDLVVALNSSQLSSYSNSIGESPDDVVHALFYCRGDVAPAECGACAQAAAARVLLDCPSEKEAVIWYDECTLRYSASQADDVVENVWASQQATATTTISVAADVYGRLFDGLVKEAAYSNNNLIDNGSMIRYFQTGKTTVTSTVSLQGLVQCAPQMSESECEGCLRSTCVGVIPSCCGWQREWVTVVRPSCLVEYRYYADASDPAGQDSSPSSMSSSSGTLLFPNAHSAWSYIKYYFVLSICVSVTITVSYTVSVHIKHKINLNSGQPQPEPPNPSENTTKNSKSEKPKKTTKPAYPECNGSDVECGSVVPPMMRHKPIDNYNHLLKYQCPSHLIVKVTHQTTLKVIQHIHILHMIGEVPRVLHDFTDTICQPVPPS